MMTDRQTNETNQNKVLGLGIGWRHEQAKNYYLDILGFAFDGKLSNDDINFLQSSVSGYGISTKNEKNRYGLVLDYRNDNLSLSTKFISAKDGELQRDGWYVQGSYKVRLANQKYFTSVEPLIRYGEMNVDMPEVATDTTTWDRNMTTIAVITEIIKNVKLKTEYYFNGEETGAAEVDNNEFLMQLEIKF